jgi:hypothetical protein
VPQNESAIYLWTWSSEACVNYSGNNAPLDLEACCRRSSKLQKTFTTWVRVRINSDHCIELRSMRVSGDWLHICRASSMRPYYRVFFPLRGAFQVKKLELSLYAKFYVILLWCRESKILCEDFWDRSRRIIYLQQLSQVRVGFLPSFFPFPRSRASSFPFSSFRIDLEEIVFVFLSRSQK